MNLLNVVNLPDTIWHPLMELYPDLVMRTELNPDRLAEYSEWAEIAFGNVPASWALSAHLAGRLQWLQLISSGVDAYGALAGSSLRVTSARGVHHRPIAQHVTMMILALTRNLPSHLTDQHEGRWKREPDLIVPVEGQQVGVIGYGGIGQELKPLVEALGMRMVGVGRNKANSNVDQWKMSRLDELLQTSDHVVLCLPLQGGTAGLMDEAKFRRMKQGAYFYNVARGELLDEAALLSALQRRQLAGAGLDVFRKEPLPKNHPFRKLPNVIATPHIAGHYRGLREATFRFFCENLARYRQGEDLANEAKLR